MAKNKLSAWKAREMLKDGTAHKKPLTTKQKHYFGMVAHGINKYEGGGWLEKYSESVGEIPLDREQALSTIESMGKVASAPQKGIVKAITGKYQTPAEAMNIHNPIGSFAVDTILDPTNLLGAGIGKNMAGRLAKSLIEPDKASTAIRLAEYIVPKPEFGNGGKMQEYQPNYNEPSVSIPPNFVGMGNDTTGRNYSPAWKGQFYNGGEIMNVANLQNPIAQNGTSLPGSVGNIYARIGAPSNGKYAKHTMASAQDGTTVYYQNGLDWNKVRGMQGGGEVNPYNQFRDYNPFPVEAPKTKEDLGVYGVDVFAGKPMEAYHFNQSYWNAQDITPRKGEIQLQDPRNIPSIQRMNPKVDREAVMNLVQGAKERGLDPATVLAMSLQESNISKFNPLNDNAQEMDTYETMKKFATKYPKGISSKTISDESLNALAEKMKYARKLGKTNEADIIQGWNGYGTIPADRPMYGIKGPIDMSKNPVYGKRIIDLRENVIKKNPELLKLLQEGSLASLEQGGSVQMKNQLVNLDQLTNFTNYNKSKNWLSKYE